MALRTGRDPDSGKRVNLPENRLVDLAVEKGARMRNMASGKRGGEDPNLIGMCSCALQDGLMALLMQIPAVRYVLMLIVALSVACMSLLYWACRFFVPAHSNVYQQVPNLSVRLILIWVSCFHRKLNVEKKGCETTICASYGFNFLWLVVAFGSGNFDSPLMSCIDGFKGDTWFGSDRHTAAKKMVVLWL